MRLVASNIWIKLFYKSYILAIFLNEGNPFALLALALIADDL